MIDTDATGQKKLEELHKATDSGEWTEFEEGFLLSMVARTYAALSDKQKMMVGRLYDKLVGK